MDLSAHWEDSCIDWGGSLDPGALDPCGGDCRLDSWLFVFWLMIGWCFGRIVVLWWDVAWIITWCVLAMRYSMSSRIIPYCRYMISYTSMRLWYMRWDCGYEMSHVVSDMICATWSRFRDVVWTYIYICLYRLCICMGWVGVWAVSSCVYYMTIRITSWVVSCVLLDHW